MEKEKKTGKENTFKTEKNRLIKIHLHALSVLEA